MGLDPDTQQAVYTIAGALLVITALLFVITYILKFKFVLGVGD